MKFLQHLALGGALSSIALAATTTHHSTTHRKTTSKHSTGKTSTPHTASATTFSPKTCVTALPTANPTANFTLVTGYPTPITVGMYTPLAGGKPSVQLEINATRYLYKVVTSTAKNGKTQKGLMVITDQFESLLINPDGSFKYIAANCSAGLTGTLPLSSATKTTSSRTSTSSTTTVFQSDRPELEYVAAVLGARVAPPGDGEPKVEIDMTLVNQCAALLPGQSPHLKCLQSIPGGASQVQFDQPVKDFEDKGNGLYVGTCEIIVDAENLCLAGEAACSSLGKFLIESGVEGVCGLLGSISGNPVVVGGAVLLCKYLIEQGLDKFCEAEDLNGDFSKCTAAAVTPVLSMQYLPGQPYTTELTLTTVGGQFSTTVSPTVTALVPSCSAKGNPFPAAAEINCASGYQLSAVYQSCDSCYESGIPWEAGEMFDIVCNGCCGCCERFPAGSGTATGPDGACCTQPNPQDNPNCYTDYCAADFASGRYQEDCNQVTVEEICTNSGYEYGHPFAECPSPDFASLFDPSSPYIFNQSLCNMGYPPPYGFVDPGSGTS